jgi:hypothetical protein
MTIDLGGIDIPTLVTYGLGIIVIVGGVVGKIYINRANDMISQIADAMYGMSAAFTEVGELMTAISDGMKDDKLTPEEWSRIQKEYADLTQYFAQCEGVFDAISNFVRR